MEMGRLIWGFFFGMIGFGFFTYGKKQRAVVPLCVGIAFFVVPYFVTDPYALIAIGLGLIALPHFVKV